MEKTVSKTTKTLYDCVEAQVKGFIPDETRNYTLRYIFYRKNDENKNACFSVITALWSMHEKTFSDILDDESIRICLVEYICEYDSSFCGVTALLKSDKEDS